MITPSLITRIAQLRHYLPRSEVFQTLNENGGDMGREITESEFYWAWLCAIYEPKPSHKIPLSSNGQKSFRASVTHNLQFECDLEGCDNPVHAQSTIEPELALCLPCWECEQDQLYAEENF